MKTNFIRIISVIVLCCIHGEYAQSMQHMGIKAVHLYSRSGMNMMGMQQRQYAITYVPGKLGSWEQINHNETLSCEFHDKWLPVIKSHLEMDEDDKNENEKSLRSINNFIGTFDYFIDLSKKSMPYRSDPFTPYDRGEYDAYLQMTQGLSLWMNVNGRKNGKYYQENTDRITPNILGACNHLSEMKREMHKMAILDHIPRKMGDPNKIMINKKLSETMHLKHLPILKIHNNKSNEDGIIEKHINHFDELILANEESLPYRYSPCYSSDFDKLQEYEVTYSALLGWMNKFDAHHLKGKAYVPKKIHSAYEHLDKLRKEFWNMTWTNGE